MRLRCALLGLLALVAFPAGSAAGDGLARCERSILGGSDAYFARRGAALARCVAKAARCPAAFASQATAADDPCLAAVAGRCQARLAAARRAGAQLEDVGARCTEPRPHGFGVPAVSFFDVDQGLAFDDIGAFCPQMAVRPEDAGDASRCQHAALACNDDAALVAAAPRAAALLARLGVALDDGGCLRASLCGNGQLDGGEECDDGSANSDTLPDACRTSCVEAFCGDGVVDTGEECDDGNQIDGDGCEGDCTLTQGVCGDGVVDAGEECDDGNQIDGDGCESDCTLTPGVCGDGVVDPGEECDDGPENSDTLPDHCRTDCSDPRCGDGVVDPGDGEECEPPGTLLCDADCQDRLPLGPLGGLVRVRATGAPAVAQADGTAAAPPEALAACQQAILRGTRRLFDRTRRPLERCVARLAHCFVGSDGGTDACLARATAPCQAVVAQRDALRAAAVGQTLSRCAAVSPVQLLDPAGGLGFARAAASCPFAAAGAPGAADVVDCAYRTVGCAAEAAVARVMPSAYGMLGETDLEPDTAFPCLTDPEAVE